MLRSNQKKQSNPKEKVSRIWILTTGLLAVLYVVAGPLAAQTSDVSSYARFQLFNACRPMDLGVASLPEDATEIGLTKESIQNSVESRLRSARLYNEAAYAYLYVGVNVVGVAYDITLQYHKVLFDPSSNQRNYATTWIHGSTGTHGRDAGYILSGVAQHMDTFLTDYLRVNEEACSRGGIRQ